LAEEAAYLFDNMARIVGVTETCRIFEAEVAKHAAERSPRTGRPGAIDEAMVEVLAHLYDHLAPSIRRYGQRRGPNFRAACREIAKDEAAGGLSPLSIEKILRRHLEEREKLQRIQPAEDV
jgi:hypothetical protein